MSKILTLDIETSPNQGYAFNVWQNNMMPGQIIKPTYMLSWSAKFLGEKKAYYRDDSMHDMHSKLHELLAEADMIVTYNGDKFDMRHINREFVERGFPRPRPLASVDMLKVVKRMFCFPHNRLDYVCSVLMGETKLETGGFDLWPAFMAGDPKARKLMKKYNVKDVRLTEKLYKQLRGWIPNHPYIVDTPDIIEDDDIEYQCGTCSSKNTTKAPRPRRTRCFLIRVYQCDDCGAWHDGKRKKVA